MSPFVTPTGSANLIARRLSSFNDRRDKESVYPSRFVCLRISRKCNYFGDFGETDVEISIIQKVLSNVAGFLNYSSGNVACCLLKKLLFRKCTEEMKEKRAAYRYVLAGINRIWLPRCCKFSTDGGGTSRPSPRTRRPGIRPRSPRSPRSPRRNLLAFLKRRQGASKKSEKRKRRQGGRKKQSRKRELTGRPP